MIIIRQAEVYNPEYLGKQDVLICGGRVEAVADHLEIGYGCQEIDARGCLLVPGFIDQHEHIIGGGGEGSFCTRSPEIQLNQRVCPVRGLWISLPNHHRQCEEGHCFCG